MMGCVSSEDKAHLTTSHLLMPPLYQKLEVDTLYAYLCLLTLPLNATPIFILNPYEKCAANSQHWNTANVLDLDSDCLVGIHTRESELFLSYATSQIDVQSFMETAMYVLISWVIFQLEPDFSVPASKNNNSPLQTAQHHPNYLGTPNRTPSGSSPTSPQGSGCSTTSPSPSHSRLGSATLFSTM
jgi:hypothetical protein